MPSSRPGLSRRSFLVTALAGGAAAVAMPDALAVDQASVFRDAAAEFAVPATLLAAFSYGQTRWVDHGGHPSRSLGYGPMHLIDGAPWPRSARRRASRPHRPSTRSPGPPRRPASRPRP
ncbi:twin-arginine translocation signal domain-containing protein [Calidifontibacter indicus]|uniref:twin-arginine translocation signal domain-containing protein n=1 Tax=Calidifontibacter indicus TaxID=419650 RepID=UPI003D754DC3